MSTFTNSNGPCKALRLMLTFGAHSVLIGYAAPASRKESGQVPATWQVPDGSASESCAAFGGSCEKFSWGSSEEPQLAATSAEGSPQTALSQTSSQWVRHEKDRKLASANAESKDSFFLDRIQTALSEVLQGPELLVFAVLAVLGILSQQDKSKGKSQSHKGVAKRPSVQERSGRLSKSGEAVETTLTLSPEEAAFQTEITEAFHSQIRKGDLDGAAQAMERLEKEGSPQLPDYNAIISLCARTNNPAGAHEWLDRVEKQGLVANSVCYNAVINAHAKRGDLQQAVAMAKKMLARKVYLDTVTYNTIIDACARAGDCISADWWMKAMKSNGVRASVVSFGSVMLACARAGKQDWLQSWLEQADAQGIELNMICFSAVINAFAKAEDLQSATKWFGVMRERKIQPSIHCFTGMLELTLNTSDWDGAAVLVDKMRSSGVEPDTAMFNWLVTACSRGGQSERAKVWAAEAAAVGCRLNRTARRAVGPDVPTVEFDAIGAALSCGPQAARAQSPDSRHPEDLIGETFIGTVKEFISAKFGYITCDETFKVFKRDIFLSSNDNPEGYAKGQRVSFILFMDPKRGLPRATEVEVYVRPKA